MRASVDGRPSELHVEVVSHVPSEAATVRYAADYPVHRRNLQLHPAVATLARFSALSVEEASVHGDFRVMRLLVTGGRFTASNSIAVAAVARKSLALHASMLRAQLWLDWCANYLFAARAIGVASRETGSFILALASEWDLDQRAMLGHTTLPAMAGAEHNLASRVFVAPTPLPAGANNAAALARWRAIYEPLVRAGLIRIRGGDTDYGLVAALVAPAGAAPRLIVATDAGGERPYVRATAAMRAVAKELCQLVIAGESDPSLSTAVSYMLLGLSQLHATSAHVAPFVLYPHRVSWAQVVGSRAWRVDLEAAIHAFYGSDMSDARKIPGVPSSVKSQLARVLHLPRVRASDGGGGDGCDPSWPYVYEDGSPAAGTAYVWRRRATGSAAPSRSAVAQHAATLARLRALGVVDVEAAAGDDDAAAAAALSDAWRHAAPGGSFEHVYAPPPPSLVRSRRGSAAGDDEAPSLGLPLLAAPFGDVRLLPGGDPDADGGSGKLNVRRVQAASFAALRQQPEAPGLHRQLGGCVPPVCPPPRVHARAFVQRSASPMHHFAYGLLEAADFFLTYGKRYYGISTKFDEGVPSLVDEIEARLRGSIDFSDRVDCAIAAEPSVHDPATAGRGALLEAARIAFFLVRLLAGDGRNGASIDEAEARGLLVRVSALRGLLRCDGRGGGGAAVLDADDSDADSTPRGGGGSALAGTPPPYVSPPPGARAAAAAAARIVPGDAAGVSVYVLLGSYDVLTHALEAMYARVACTNMCGVALRGVGAITPGLAHGNPMGKAVQDRLTRVAKKSRLADDPPAGDEDDDSATRRGDAAGPRCGKGAASGPLRLGTPERTHGTASGAALVGAFTLRCLRWPKPPITAAAPRGAEKGGRAPAAARSMGVLKVSEGRMQWAELFPDATANADFGRAAEFVDLGAAVCGLADGDGIVASDADSLDVPPPAVAMDNLRMRVLMRSADYVGNADEGDAGGGGGAEAPSRRAARAATVTVIGVTPRIYFAGLAGEPTNVESIVMQALTTTLDPRALMQHRMRLTSNESGAVARGGGDSSGASRPPSAHFPPLFGEAGPEGGAWVAAVRRRALHGGARLVGEPRITSMLVGDPQAELLLASSRSDVGHPAAPDGGTLVIEEGHPAYARLAFCAAVTHVVEPTKGFMTPRLRAEQLGAAGAPGAPFPATAPPTLRGTGWRAVYSENMLWDALLAVVLRPVIMATPASVLAAAVAVDDEGGDGTAPPPPPRKRSRPVSAPAPDARANLDATAAAYVPPSLVPRVRLARADAEAVAANLAWVWKHPWQASPLDFPGADFVQMRQPLYDAWMGALRSMSPCQLAAHAAAVADAAAGGCADSFRARAHLFPRDDVCELLHAAGPAAVVRIIDRLARDHDSHFSGLPDVSAWQPMPCPHCPFGVAGDGAGGAPGGSGEGGAEAPYLVDVDATTAALVVAPLRRRSPDEPAPYWRRGRWLFSARAFTRIADAAAAKVARPSGEFVLVEVKSASDAVRRHQLEWMAALENVANVALVTVVEESERR